MNSPIPILHEIANGLVYIVQTNIIGLGQLDLPVMLRVIPLQPVDMTILNKHVKGKYSQTCLKQAAKGNTKIACLRQVFA